MVRTEVEIGRGLTIKNPVMTASGTYGYGTEYKDFIDIDRLGAIVVKGTTLHHRDISGAGNNISCAVETGRSDRGKPISFEK